MNPNGLQKIRNRLHAKPEQTGVAAVRKSAFTAKRRSILTAAFLFVAGATVGVFAIRHQSKEDPAQENATQLSARATDTISAGGTISAAQLFDYLGMESTDVSLSVEKVYVSSGDTVAKGDALYQLTDESVQKAATTLESELTSAQSALLNQTLSYETDKNAAYSLYQSELLTSDAARAEYNSGLEALDTALQTALDAYQQSQGTISTAPETIAQKQSALAQAEQVVTDYSGQLTTLQQTQDSKKTTYESAANTYNAQVNDYNAAAGVVRYLGAYIGKDVSDVTMADVVNVSTATAATSPSSPTDSGGQTPPGNGTGMSEAPRLQSSADTSIATLYQNARQEYETKKQALDQAMRTFQSAERSYQSAAEAVTSCQNTISTSKVSVTTLEKEISTLESALSKAKSEVSTQKAEYTELKNSYAADKLTLQNTYDTAIASGENASYHYELTLSTIEDDLADAQDAVDTAEENQRVFTQTIADGVVKAQQDGTIASVTYEADDVMKLSSATVCYVDNNSFGATVELDQYDVTEIAIGDSVILYASDSGMVSGKITSISAGESTSLANVKFNVTVVADDNTKLYSGESVNVYFNAKTTDASAFQDAEPSDDDT